MTIKEKLSETLPARALRQIKKLREKELGDIAADVVNSKRVRTNIQKRINQVLHIQRMVSEGMGTALGMVNISSRDDMQEVASKLATVEDVMAQLHVEMRQLRVALAQRAPGGAAEQIAPPAVKRTRKPPAPKV